VILTAVLFALAHAYQGRSGILGTFVMGILFGVVRLAYDTLIPVMMMHTVVDLVAGIAGPRYLLPRPAEEQK
jgi:membrane protease YdiL (CAAX protease family)